MSHHTIVPRSELSKEDIMQLIQYVSRLKQLRAKLDEEIKYIDTTLAELILSGKMEKSAYHIKNKS